MIGAQTASTVSASTVSASTASASTETAAPRRRRERGSGTVLVLVLMMLLVAAGGTAALVGAAVGVRHQAETAADLAALAGASAAANGAAPCPAAARIATANRAVVTECTVAGTMVNLTVTVQPRGPLARLPAASAGARAGPDTGGGRGLLAGG